MNWFEKVQRYYNWGYYTNDDVKIFVQAKKVTLEQYKEITGIEYIL